MRQLAPEFLWDDANRNHIAQHDISSAEAEAAVLDPHALFLEIQSESGEERVKALGSTAAGRILVVIFTIRSGAIRPITGYSATRRLQEQYLKRRGI